MVIDKYNWSKFIEDNRVAVVTILPMVGTDKESYCTNCKSYTHWLITQNIEDATVILPLSYNSRWDFSKCLHKAIMDKDYTEVIDMAKEGNLQKVVAYA